MKSFQGMALLLLAILASGCAVQPAGPNPDVLDTNTPGSTQSAALAQPTRATPTRPASITPAQADPAQTVQNLPAVIWERRGGRMRSCQVLTIYAPDQLFLRDCLASAQPLAWEPDSQQADRLAGFLALYGSFTWSSPMHKGLADAFVDSYSFNGQGSQVPTAAEQGALNAFLAELASSAPNPNPTTSFEDSGIEGRVMLSPACPGPLRVDQPCPDAPWQGALLVVDTVNQTIAEIQTSQDGSFKITLPPGTYTLRPQQSGPGRLAPPVQVIVLPGEYTYVEITLDSGMR